MFGRILISRITLTANFRSLTGPEANYEGKHVLV